MPSGAQAEAPGLDIDAAIPKARLGGGDGYVCGAGDVEADKLIAGGGVSHVHGLAVHSDGEGGRAQLFGYGRGLHAGSGMGGGRKSENGHEKRTKTQQEARPRQKSGNETTVAPATKTAVSDAFAHRDIVAQAVQFFAVGFAFGGFGGEGFDWLRLAAEPGFKLFYAG